jgi:hypothetical protein
MIKHVVGGLVAICMFLSVNLYAQKIWTGRVYVDKTKILNTLEARIGLGASVGGTRTAMDFGLNGISWHAAINANMVSLRFVHFNIDASLGNLVGGPIQLEDIDGMKNAQFTAQFTQFSGVIRCLPLRVFVWDEIDPIAEVFSFIYAGLGYGFILSETDATPLTAKEFGFWHDRKIRAGGVYSRIGC